MQESMNCAQKIYLEGPCSNAQYFNIMSEVSEKIIYPIDKNCKLDRISAEKSIENSKKTEKNSLENRTKNSQIFQNSKNSKSFENFSFDEKNQEENLANSAQKIFNYQNFFLQIANFFLIFFFFFK